MANTGPMSGRRPMLPTPPQGQVIARYGTYLEAQRAVDFLSDNHFVVQAVTIVGTDLRMVERVTGRLYYGRVAVAGALTGAWFGLFVGLVLSVVSTGTGLGIAGVLAAILIGAGFGMLFGVMSFAATGGRRDFTSQSQIVASEYQVLCLEEHARGAMEVLGRLPADGRRGADPAAPLPAPPPRDPSGMPGDPGQRGGVDATPAAEPPEPDVSGPTYGEMMERQRQERRALEDAAREDAEQQSRAREEARRAKGPQD